MHRIPTDWCWCRDNGPIFAFDDEGPLIIDWRFTGWTNEPPYAADDAVPARVADELRLRIISHNLVVEGGALEFNGAGTVIASHPCLRDRNKKMNDEQIEEALRAGLCIEHVVWLETFEIDDITNGHPDGIARFADAQTVVVGEVTNNDDTEHHVYEDAAARMAGAGFVVKRMPIPGRIKHGHKTMLGEKETSSAGEQLANRCSSCL